MLTNIKKILSILDKSQRKKLGLIIGSITFMGLVEMMGVATIFPFIAILTNPGAVNDSHYLNILYNFFGFSTTNQFMLFLGGLVFFILVVGNLFSALISKMIINYCFNNGKKISSRLLEKYLSQHYTYYLNRHTSELSKNVLSEVDKLVTGVFMSSLLSISKMVMIIGIFSLLVAVDPRLALTTILILGGAYILIYLFIRKKLLKAGQAAAKQNAFRYRLTDEVFGSIKEIKILDSEKNFLDYYQASTSAYVKAESLNQMSPMISRYIIEVIAFGGMVLIALFLIATQENPTQFMPLLGLYALAGYRLMPAMQQQFTSFSALRYNLPSLDIIYNEMKLPIYYALSQNQPKIDFRKELSLREVCFTYPQANRKSLQNVSLTIKLNSTIGLVGVSGAGKTTLIDIILGLLTPQQGELLVDGVVINNANLRGWQRNIGYVSQQISLMDMTVAENIALGVKPQDIDMQAVKRAATLANLDMFITNELPQGYHTSIGERGIRLSGGQRQRIGIARALYHDPELLIFDEATSALDGATEKVIMEAIKNLSKQKTIILIAHRLNTVKECDDIYVLEKGKLAGHGSYNQLINSNQAFQFLVNA